MPAEPNRAKEVLAYSIPGPITVPACGAQEWRLARAQKQLDALSSAGLVVVPQEDVLRAKIEAMEALRDEAEWSPAFASGYGCALAELREWLSGAPPSGFEE